MDILKWKLKQAIKPERHGTSSLQSEQNDGQLYKNLKAIMIEASSAQNDEHMSNVISHRLVEIEVRDKAMEKCFVKIDCFQNSFWSM